MASSGQPGFQLYRHQEEMIEPLSKRENIVILAPCGSGKTFAVVNAWLKKRPTRHLVYVLPTQTLLRSIYKAIACDIAKPDRLPGFRVIPIEEKTFLDDATVTMATDYGQHRETYLYAHDIILTTLDSYLARLYRGILTRQRYRDLPIGRVLNSTTVFDEAHMYDKYTHTLLRYTLSLLRVGRGHHVLMTATLNDKVGEYLGVWNDSYHRIQVPRDLACEENWESFTGIQEVRSVQRCLPQDFSSLVRTIICSEGIQQVLIVCNTVKRTQETYRALKEAFPTLLLHSRFIPGDREKREKEISDWLENKDRYCIVSTQVVEAGLDISVPNLITEISPGDSFVQRQGRCARRKGEKGVIYPVKVEDEKPYPYEKEEIDSLDQLLRSFGEGVIDGVMEREIVNLVAPPSLSNEAEAKARSLILNAFLSVSAFGEPLYILPTRDATPVHLYVGEETLREGPVDSIKPIINQSVRIDIRLLKAFSEKGFSAFNTVYVPSGEEGIEGIQLQERPVTAWSIVQVQGGVDYDAEEGLRI